MIVRYCNLSPKDNLNLQIHKIVSQVLLKLTMIFQWVWSFWDISQFDTAPAGWFLTASTSLQPICSLIFDCIPWGTLCPWNRSKTSAEDGALPLTRVLLLDPGPKLILCQNHRRADSNVVACFHSAWLSSWRRSRSTRLASRKSFWIKAGHRPQSTAKKPCKLLGKF